MSKPPSTWKRFELMVARKFGGKRRGPEYRTATGGTNDVEVEGFSIECKYGAQMGYKKILDACKQAQQARESEYDIPIAVVKQKGYNNDDALVCMTITEFVEWFV